MHRVRAAIAQREKEGEVVQIDVPADYLDDFRLMLREQIAGDVELVRDMRDGILGRRADRETLASIERRIAFSWALASAVGGVYGGGGDAEFIQPIPRRAVA